MNVYEMYKLLIEKFPMCKCVDKDNNVTYSNLLDLPVKFAEKPEYRAEFKE